MSERSSLSRLYAAIAGIVVVSLVSGMMTAVQAKADPSQPSIPAAAVPTNTVPDTSYKPEAAKRDLGDDESRSRQSPPPAGSPQAEALASVRSQISVETKSARDREIDDKEDPGAPESRVEALSPAKDLAPPTSLSTTPEPADPEGLPEPSPDSPTPVPTPSPNAEPTRTSDPEPSTGSLAANAPNAPATLAAGVCDPVPGAPYGAGYSVLETSQQLLPRNNAAGSLRVEVANNGTVAWPAGSALSYQRNGVYGPSTTFSGAVQPGQKVTLEMRVQALPPGEHRLELDVNVAGIGWLTGQGVCRYPVALILQNWQPSFSYEAPVSPSGSVTTRTPFLTVLGSDPDAWPSALTYQSPSAMTRR